MTTLTAVSFMRHRLGNYAPGDSVPCSYEEWAEIFNALKAAESQLAAEKERAEKAERERDLIASEFSAAVRYPDLYDARYLPNSATVKDAIIKWAAAEAAKEKK